MRRAISTVLLLAGLVAGCAAPAEHPALQQAAAVLERARSSARVRALAPAELDRAEVALQQARTAAGAGAAAEQVAHLAYVARQRAALAEARAVERVARSEVDVLQRAVHEVVPHRRPEQAGRGSFGSRARQRRAPQEQARASLAQEARQEPQEHRGRQPIEGEQPTRVRPEPNQQARAAVPDDQEDRAAVPNDREDLVPLADDPGDRFSYADDREDRASPTDGQQARAPLKENGGRASGETGQDGRTVEPDSIVAGAAVAEDITLRLAQLSFEGAEPTSETGAQLAAVAARLLREPERSLAIEAEFDLPDPEARTVMERRVEVVRALLLQRGIAPARLVVRAGGHGPAQPQATSSFVEAP